MVSVLDMLCQPVLSPVNLFTANWYLEVLESNKTCNASSCDQCSYSWESHRTCPLHTQSVVLQGFQLGKYFRIFRMLGYSKNIFKKNSVLIINPLVKCSERFIPDIRIWDIMKHMSPIGKVCIPDMLNKPDLNKINEVTIKGNTVAIEFVHQALVFCNMVLSISLEFLSFDLKELSFFIIKMLLHQLLQALILFCIFWVVHRLSDGIKKTNMLIIKLFVENLK